MGLCLSKRDVCDKNENPLAFAEEESNAGVENGSTSFRICVEVNDTDLYRHSFGIPKQIQSPPSKLMELFVKSMSPIKSKIPISGDLEIPRTLSTTASSMQDDDLFPRLNVVKSGNSVISKSSEDFPATRLSEESSATEKCEPFEISYSLNALLTEDWIMKSSLQDPFEGSKTNVLNVNNQGNDGAFRGISGSEGIVNDLGEESSAEIQSHKLQGGEAFGSPFSIDSGSDEEFHQGGEIVKRLQQCRHNSHGSQQNALVTTTQLPYSSSSQDNARELSQGRGSQGIAAYSKRCEIPENLASKAAVADPEYSEDTSSESSSDLFDLQFLSGDVVMGPSGVSESTVVQIMPFSL